MATPSAKEIVSKADLAVADLVSNGGFLQPEQANSFLDMVYDEPTLLKKSRFVKMGGPEMKINKIGFGSRILRPGPAEGVTLNASDRAKIGTSQISLLTKKYMAEIHITYDVLEDNIEKGNLENTIMQHMAKQVALDLEEVFLLGDTASTVDTLALQDGIIKRATAHNLALTSPNNTISNDVFVSIVKEMPDKYLRDMNSLRYFMSTNQYIDYRKMLADRQTGLGDAMIQGTNQIYSQGIALETAALMPNSKILFGDPRNWIWGVQRDIMIETDKDIRAQEYIIVLSLRAAIQVEETDAMVLVTGLA